jgi:TonB-linked SusC/RagA family outer membrane protein
MKNLKQLFRQTIPMMLMLMAYSTTLHAQDITVKGTVTDATEEPLIGASVVVKGKTSQGTVTDFDGNFTLKVPSEQSVLVISYVGMTTKEMKVGKQRSFKVTLSDDTQLEEVVVVGYGQQKKASVVGAITQTTGAVLERAAGISDVGAALTGNLPGVVTTQGNGQPGEEEPDIVIRSASSWNNSSPLILVDGIERPMSSVDIASVQSISVLKDASATAVYGVKGANGVILITTKRGQEGRAKISASANVIMKIPSKLPGKYDSYDALMYRNKAIENQLPLNPGSWSDIRSQEFINNFRNQTTLEQRERYPNIDWQDELFKDYCMSYNANVNVSGGTKFVKYFASIDFVHEGDLFKIMDSGRGYKGGFGYNRINVRSNLDFQITKTTVLKVNLAGSNGQRKHPLANSGDLWQEQQRWAGAYNIAPDVFMPQYSDGSWGFYPAGTNISNSAENIALAGYQTDTHTRINTDFVLEQDLSFITKGLNFHGMISWDNNFVETGRGVNDLYNDAQRKWIDPLTGEVTTKQSYETNNQFDFQQPVKWTTQNGSVDNNQTVRNLTYQLQLNWARKFGQHDVSAMGLFSRQEYAYGSEIPHYREDWAFRATYNYAGRYFLEYNGAYNGSEKFSKDNRFAFFNSGAIGWLVSEEKFFQPIKKWVDMLKFRVSYGEIGDDNVGGRWLYATQWAFGGKAKMDTDPNYESTYEWYREATLGNLDVHWEKVKKWNYGVDFGILGGLFTGSLDFFNDKRTDILINGADRATPAYFGATPATINKGIVKTHGYELTLRFNKVLKNKMRFWADMNMTHAVNKIEVRDDQPLLPAYRKQAGFSINQVRSYLDAGYLNTFDDIYGAPRFDASDNQRLPGDYYIIDFNGDGVVDSNDSAPYGYSSTPQNTYNATIGWEWKGFSCFVQFYGVTNVTREVTMTNFGNNIDTVYDQGTWWSKENPDADMPPSRWNLPQAPYVNGTRYYYDGSFIRLKNAEVAYTFTQPWVRKFGMESIRLYVSGNNLWLWTRMPDDRESNLGGYSGGGGAYPTVRRINFGIKLGF